jgi:hypothetical protein
VYFLEKSRAKCFRKLKYSISPVSFPVDVCLLVLTSLRNIVELYTIPGCYGEPSDIITEVPSGCIDISTKFSYRAVCY